MERAEATAQKKAYQQKKVEELRKLYSNFDRQVRRLNMLYEEKILACCGEMYDIIKLNERHQQAVDKLRKMLNEDVMAVLLRVED
jgi:hypothetical protein